MSSASKNGAGRGPYVQKRDSSGQEGVGTSKKGRFQARKGRHVQIEQERVQRRPKTGQEGVGASEKRRFRARRGRRVQKRGRKGSARLKRDSSGQEGVGASKIEQGEVSASQNGAGSGRRVQKRGRKRSVHPKRDD